MKWIKKTERETSIRTRNVKRIKTPEGQKSIKEEM